MEQKFSKLKADTAADELMNTLLAEGEVYAIMEQIDHFTKHLRMNVPESLYLGVDGQPNIRTRWGAVLFHLQMARASIRGFM